MARGQNLCKSSSVAFQDRLAARKFLPAPNCDVAVCGAQFNADYVQAFETILAIEKAFGTQLREHAIRISKERYTLRQEAMTSGGFQNADVFMRTKAESEQMQGRRPASESPALGDPR